MFSLAPLEKYLLVLQAAQRLNDAWAPLPLPQWELWDWLSCNITPCPTDVILVRFSCNPLLPWPDSVRHSRAYSVASHLKQWSQNPSTPFCWQILHCGGDLIGYCAEGRFGACGGEATLSLTTAVFAFSFLTSLNSNWSKLVTFPRLWLDQQHTQNLALNSLWELAATQVYVAFPPRCWYRYSVLQIALHHWRSHARSHSMH